MSVRPGTERQFESTGLLMMSGVIMCSKRATRDGKASENVGREMKK